jgi:CheY-like chemotaxis protein
MAAQRALIVANQTLGGRELLLRVEHLNNPRGLTSFHIVVPATPGDGADGAGDARRRLDAAMGIISDLGAEVTGEVGPPDPLVAVREVLARGEPFTEIIVSTQPPGISRWLHMDLPHRIGRLTHLPVEHVICTTEDDVTTMVADTAGDSASRATTNGDAPVRVLLVEDSATDVELTRIALERSSIATDVQVTTGGKEALDLLRGSAGSPRYDVVLLDLKMPGMTGHEVLAELQRDTSGQHPPVVVLTTSGLETDRQEAHRLGAHAYILKEANFGHFQEVLEGVIREFAPSPSSG